MLRNRQRLQWPLFQTYGYSSSGREENSAQAEIHGKPIIDLGHSIVERDHAATVLQYMGR